MRDRFVLTTLAVLLLLLPGCGSRVSRIQLESSILDPSLGLTVLRVHTPGPTWIEDLVEDAAGCATSAVAKVPKARLARPRRFRRYVLPDQTGKVPLTRELFGRSARTQNFNGAPRPPDQVHRRCRRHHEAAEPSQHVYERRRPVRLGARVDRVGRGRRRDPRGLGGDHQCNGQRTAVSADLLHSDGCAFVHGDVGLPQAEAGPRRVPDGSGRPPAMKPIDASPTATRCRDLVRSVFAVGVTASLLAGCAATDSRLLPPPSEQLRSHMLSVTVARAGSVPETVFHGPAKGALEGAWRGARIGFVTPLLMAPLVVAPAAPRAAALGAAAIVALAPVGALLGATIGAASAEPSAKIQETEAVIRQALAESQARERFRDCVEVAVREQAPHVSLAPRAPRAPTRSWRSPSSASGSPAIPGSSTRHCSSS